MSDKKERIDSSVAAVFKKKLTRLAQYKGRGTELISLYLPEDADRSSVMGQLTEEISQSSNIKSPSTRKNVQGALRKIIGFLKGINFSIPKNGVVIFSGNVSEQEGKIDIRIFTVRPPVELKTKLYWCDSEFHLAPLKEMVKPSEVYGIVTIDKNEATIATLEGKRYDIVARHHSMVAGKTRAGGQCLAEGSLVMLSDGKIEEIQDLHNPSSLKSADFENYEVKDSFIEDKWVSQKPFLHKIITKYPRMELNCSSDHVLFCWEGGTITEKPASKLKEGDFLVMPEHIKTSGKIQRVGTNYFNSYVISKKGKSFFRKLRQDRGYTQTEFGKKLGLHQASVSSFERGAFNPRLSYLKKMCSVLEVDFDWFVGEYCKPKSNLKLPSMLSSEFAQVLGYIMGDGCFEKEGITFFEEDSQIIKKYGKLVKVVFSANQNIRFRESKNYYQLRLNGKPIVRQISKEFPELKKARTSCIPQKVLKSTNNVLGAFLRGLFDAEGYVCARGLGMGLNNKKLVQQVQLALLRFGIIASMHEYDNNRNKYSNNPRYTISITEKDSLKRFAKLIGFESAKKAGKLCKLIKIRKNKSSMRQMVVSGKEVRKLFKASGLNTQQFPKVSDFFRDNKMRGKQTFKNSVLSVIEGHPELERKFSKMFAQELMPVKIMNIEREQGSYRLHDISVNSRNFIANGLVVHNSAHRFERLREEAAQDFYKKISDRLNEIFLPYGERLKGLIVGGPGITKNYFLNKDIIDHRLKKKIIGQVDTSYTDESGVREVVQKSEDLLRDTDLMKERTTISGFLEEIAKDGLAAYGEKEVNEALEQGKVETLLVSEDLEWRVEKRKCLSCNRIEEEVIKDSVAKRAPKCSGCGAGIETLEEIDYLDFLIEKAQSTGANVKVISTDSPEGQQFLEAFGGIGAMLRFK